MNTLLRLQLALSNAIDRRPGYPPARFGDQAFEPLCAILDRMAKAPETPRTLRRAIRQARAGAGDGTRKDTAA